MRQDLGSLAGTWRVDPEDRAAVELYGDATMQFEADGSLLYTTVEGPSTSVLRLVYRIEDHWIVTDQPSHPREERTRFDLDGETLTLWQGDVPCRFLKVSTSRPSRAGPLVRWLRGERR